MPSVAKRIGHKIAVLSPGGLRAPTTMVSSAATSARIREMGSLRRRCFAGGSVQRLPRRDGETSSRAQAVTNSGIALINSVSAAGTLQYLRRPNGAVTDLVFDPYASSLAVNSNGVVAGITYSIHV